MFIKRFFSSLTHVDKNGKAAMVDISNKAITVRTAKAQASMYVSQPVLLAIKNNMVQKGDVLTVAKIAAINATKITHNLIPLCHPIKISHTDVKFTIVNYGKIIIESTVSSQDQTGVEM